MVWQFNKCNDFNFFKILSVLVYKHDQHLDVKGLGSFMPIADLQPLPFLCNPTNAETQTLQRR